MSAPPKPPLKPLKWVGGSKKSLDAVPASVKDVFGSASLDVQYGDTPDGVRQRFAAAKRHYEENYGQRGGR